MPTRRLPNSGATRLKAMQAAKERKDAVPPPPFIPLIPLTITRLDTFYPAYKAKVEAMEAALYEQTLVSAQVKAARPDAEMFISHFFQALQNGIAREIMAPSVRAFYGLAVNDGNVPPLKTEADIAFWGDKAVTGEAARIAAGGTAIPYPTIAEVNAKVNPFKTANQAQANAKDVYDLAQEAVETDNPEADKLVLKMWNEIEAAFDEGNKPSMRRKAREWGVVYTIGSGETINPEEFSITGTVTNSVTGAPVIGAAVIVQSPEVIVTTDALGKYYVPRVAAGTYQMTLHKEGYKEEVMEGIVVTDGVIDTIDVQLIPFASVVLEGDAFLGTINDLDTSGFTFTDSTTVQVLVGLNELLFSYAPAPGPTMGATVWHVAPGTQNKTIDAFKALVGASDINTFFKVQCVGPVGGHYKITFNNVIMN